MAQAAKGDPPSPLTNGFEEHIGSQAAHATSSRTVLTLFGGDRQAKQLFSSLGKRKSPDTDDLSEQALPAGISTTEIIPTHSLDDDDDRKATTFRENFPPPLSLALLAAPRPSKHTTSRSGPVTWHTPSATSRKVVDRRSFATQGLPTGNWLTYNAPPTPQQQSPESKRKQRDRALSFGEAQSSTNDEATATHNTAKDDALFRSVYSSFAPDRDDSSAIIPAQEKNRMWYARYGRETYEELLDTKYQMLYGEPTDDGDQEETFDEEDVKEVLDNWDPPGAALENELSVNGNTEPTEKEAAELLAEISDLLETLNSYQRIRNETLPTATRSLTGSIPTASGSSTHPASPSTAEFEVYEALKAQLTTIVSGLPPYMLSKLDGNKLGALNVSTRIQIAGKNQKGTLQEDELSAKARAAVRTPVPAAAPQTPGVYSGARGNSGYHPPTQTSASHYTRPPYGAPVSAPRPGMPQSYPSNQYAARPPAGYPAGGVRGGAGPPYVPQGSYGAHRPPSYTERFANGVAQYGSPQSFSNYSNGSYRPPGQQASNYAPQYSTPQSRVPASAAAQLQAYRATQSEYLQRTAAPGQTFSYGSTSMSTSGSPQPTQQHRLSFSAAGQSPKPQRPPLHQQSSSNHGSRSPQPQMNGVGGGGAGRMSPDEQSALMSRQKAQVAEAAHQIRQASGTPQPAVPNGASRNGTPVVQAGRG